MLFAWRRLLCSAPHPALPPSSFALCVVGLTCADVSGRKRGSKSGARFALGVAHIPSIYLGVINLLLVFGDRTCATLRQRHAKPGSHAQRTPLNMGALHRVTAGLAQYYRARTRGDVKERSHPHRLRTRTRGFAPLLSCSRTRGAEMAIWAVSGGSKQGECKRSSPNRNRNHDCNCEASAVIKYNHGLRG